MTIRRKWLIGGGVVVMLAVLAWGAYYADAFPQSSTSTQKSTPVAATTAAHATRPRVRTQGATASVAYTVTTEKFSDFPHKAQAEQIFPGSLSADAQKALEGFSLSTKDLADGSTAVTITPQQTAYRPRTITVKQGETLYFVDLSGGDDVVNGIDTDLHDDSPVLVNQQGYIVNLR